MTRSTATTTTSDVVGFAPSDASPEVVAAELGTSLDNGLSDDEAERRLARDGPNELEEAPPPTFIVLFAQQLMNLMILLLIAAAIASLGVNAGSDARADGLSCKFIFHFWFSFFSSRSSLLASRAHCSPRTNNNADAEGIAIFAIVLANALVGATCEKSAGSALEALSQLSQPTCVCVRSGKEVSACSKSVVVGDVVVLSVGDIVPADLRLATANDLLVCEFSVARCPQRRSHRYLD